MRDSKDQMRLSGGQSLADGLTAATPLFSSLWEENANESRHLGKKFRTRLCGFWTLGLYEGYSDDNSSRMHFSMDGLIDYIHPIMFYYCNASTIDLISFPLLVRDKFSLSLQSISLYSFFSKYERTILFSVLPN